MTKFIDMNIITFVIANVQMELFMMKEITFAIIKVLLWIMTIFIQILIIYFLLSKKNWIIIL